MATLQLVYTAVLGYSMSYTMVPTIDNKFSKLTQQQKSIAMSHSVIMAQL